MLRDQTGVGMADCKEALEEAEGDIEQAVIILRKKGYAKAAKRSDHDAKEGMVVSYVHPTGKIGVLVEVGCETDFVARNTVFQEFAHDVALQVASERPQYLSRAEVPESVLAQEKAIIEDSVSQEGKPPEILQKIVAGRLQKYYQQVCLLDQPFIKDDKKTVGDVVSEFVLKMGENIQIRQFVRFQIGG